MKLGCHAVLFKEKIASDTNEVIRQVHETGFAGTEIGARFFGTEKKDFLNRILTEHGVELSGMHCAFKLVDFLENRESVETAVLRVASFVADMPNKNIVMTGMHKLPQEEEADPRLKDEGFVREVALAINDLAKKVKTLGVSINYHNHSWEFHENGLIFHSLGKYAPDLLFGLDTGWAFSMDFDPVELMDLYPGRFHYIHIRDYNRRTGEFVNLGAGDHDLKRLMAKLQSILGADDWGIVEYETGEEDFQRYAEAFRYLKRIM